MDKYLHVISLLENANRSRGNDSSLKIFSSRCPTLHMHTCISFSLICDPMECSPQISSVYGIFQARKLGWVAISSSKGSSGPRDQTHSSCMSCTGHRFSTTGPPGKTTPIRYYTLIKVTSLPCRCLSSQWPLKSGYHVLASFLQLSKTFLYCSRSCLILVLLSS